MSRRKPDLSILEDRIGHRFKDRDLLTRALTHVSSKRGGNYQRLEFLGDRVLGLAVADLLYESFPTGTEGDLSRRLSELVRKETCAEVAEGWGVGPYLKLRGSDAGIRKSRSVLADACESVIAAVFLDDGYPAARALIEREFGERLRTPSAPPINAKAALQEWALARGLPVPVYEIVERIGPDHAPRFRVAARVETKAPAQGEGASRRVAEQDAAQNLLLRERVWKEARHVGPDRG